MNKFAEHTLEYKEIILHGCYTNYVVEDYVGKIGWEKVGDTLEVMVRSLTSSWAMGSH